MRETTDRFVCCWFFSPLILCSRKYSPPMVSERTKIKKLELIIHSNVGKFDWIAQGQRFCLARINWRKILFRMTTQARKRHADTRHETHFRASSFHTRLRRELPMTRWPRRDVQNMYTTQSTPQVLSCFLNSTHSVNRSRYIENHSIVKFLSQFCHSFRLSSVLFARVRHVLNTHTHTLARVSRNF